MSTRKYDYAQLRDEFVHSRESISIRELCRRHDMLNNRSTVGEIAKREDWEGARAAWQGRVTETSDKVTATDEARRRAKAHAVAEKALDVIDRVLNATLAQIDEKHYVKAHDSDGAEIWVERYLHHTSPNAAATLIAQLKEVGRFSLDEGSGSSSAAGELVAGADVSTLRLLVELTRGHAEQSAVVGSPLPRVEAVSSAQPRRVGGSEG